MVLVVLWVIATILTLGAAALAVLALSPRKRLLVVPASIPVVILVVASLFDSSGPGSPALGAILGLGIVVIGVAGGSPVVSLLLEFSTHGNATLGTHGGILVRDAAAPAPAQREILRGGATIGYLERFALIGSVIVGQVAAVAVIVAIKGLGRFSELVDEQARERFIIGTLASLIWASLCAAALTTLG